MLQGNQIVEETILLEEIQRNSTKKQEVLKELEKRDVQSCLCIHSVALSSECINNKMYSDTSCDRCRDAH